MLFSCDCRIMRSNELLSNFKLFEKDGGRLELPKQF